MLRHVDLCSGIGGFALGFEWAELSNPVLFCDIDPWSRKVINKHWPDVPIAEDVKDLANDPERFVPDCEILTAGYPCQPFSQAGRRKGEEDPRHIFPYIMQIVASKRPSWCVFENVYGHVSMGLDTALTAMEAEGYATRPFIIPAVSLGAPHRRDRVFIVGRLVGDTEHDGPSTAEVGGEHGEDEAGASQGAQEAEQSPRTGLPGDEQTVGNSGGGGRSGFNWGWTGQELTNGCSDVAYPNDERLQGGIGQGAAGTQGQSGGHVTQRSSDVAYPDGERGRGGDTQRQDAEDAGQPSRDSWSVTGGVETWGVEPDVGRVANGIPKRVDRIRGLGNAIVPQIAKQIGLAIKESI